MQTRNNHQWRIYTMNDHYSKIILIILGCLFSYTKTAETTSATSTVPLIVEKYIESQNKIPNAIVLFLHTYDENNRWAQSRIETTTTDKNRPIDENNTPCKRAFIRWFFKNKDTEIFWEK